MGKIVDANRSVGCPITLVFNQVTLKVRPQDLVSKAAEIRRRAMRIENDFRIMTQAINRTQGYWNGDAADLHRKRYQEMVPEAEDMFATLKQHAENLENIAKAYISSEDKIAGMSAQLPKNAIE